MVNRNKGDVRGHPPPRRNVVSSPGNRRHWGKQRDTRGHQHTIQQTNHCTPLSSALGRRLQTWHAVAMQRGVELLVSSNSRNFRKLLVHFSLGWAEKKPNPQAESLFVNSGKFAIITKTEPNVCFRNLASWLPGPPKTIQIRARELELTASEHHNSNPTAKKARLRFFVFLNK